MSAASDAGSGSSIRQLMTWLHTWVGLWFCWLLFAVFLTGTFAVFEEPITHWMTPEHHAAEAGNEIPADLSGIDHAKRLAVARDYLLAHHSESRLWSIWPGDRTSGGDLIAWVRNDKTGDFDRYQLDPDTGLPQTEGKEDEAVRETLGGHHFVDFHYELHAGTIGLWIVAIAAMAMVVTLISGVIIHKRIFKDFFTFRVGKGQRSWLDAHNAVAVLTLPFQFMIAYTGLAFYPTTYLPAANIHGAAIETAGEQPWTGKPATVPDLAPFAQEASQRLAQPIHAVMIHNPGDSAMRIRVFGSDEPDAEQRRISRAMGIVTFDAASRRVLRVQHPGEGEGPASTAQGVMDSLHMAEFGGWPVKWLYFMCGLAGTAMMGTGAILFMVKRRNRHGNEFGGATTQVYRLIEGLNVAAISGLGIASIAYLWSNRLIPADLIGRETLELRAFFGVWLATLAHGFLRPAKRAWVEQLALIAALCLGLSLLNLLTTGDHLVAQLGRGDWESAGVELVTIAFGIGAAWAVRTLHRQGQDTPRRTHRPRPTLAIEATKA